MAPNYNPATYARRRARINQTPNSAEGVFSNKIKPKINQFTETQKLRLMNSQRILAKSMPQFGKVATPRQNREVILKEDDLSKAEDLANDFLVEARDEKIATRPAYKKVDPSEEFLRPVKGFDLDITSEEIKEKPRKKWQMEPKKEKSVKKPRKKRWIFRLIPLVIVLTIAGVILKWGDEIISKITGGKSGVFDTIGAIVSEKNVPLKTANNGRTNLLLFGTSGYRMNDEKHDGAQLTDSIMVVSLDQNTKDVAMLSLPRDLKVGRTCTATGKINELYWCSNQYDKDERAGEEALRTKVEKILGISIQYSAHINWGALVSTVNALGGITVVLDENINDTWTKTFIKKGVPTNLNGEQALGLARARHGTEGGDFSRGNSQQKILIALQKRIMEKGFGFTEIFNLINTIGDNLRMTANIEEIKTIVKIGKDFNMNNIRHVSITDWKNNANFVKPATIDGISYVIPTAGVDNYSEIQKYIAKQFSSDPKYREKENILVLNASGISGAAAQERSKLESAGFKVGMVGDAPTEQKWTKRQTIYVMNENLPGKKKMLTEFYPNADILKASDLPESIKNGKDFDFIIVIGTPN